MIFYVVHLLGTDSSFVARLIGMAFSSLTSLPLLPLLALIFHLPLIPTFFLLVHLSDSHSSIFFIFILFSYMLALSKFFASQSICLLLISWMPPFHLLPSCVKGLCYHAITLETHNFSLAEKHLCPEWKLYYICFVRALSKFSFSPSEIFIVFNGKFNIVTMFNTLKPKVYHTRPMIIHSLSLWQLLLVPNNPFLERSNGACLDVGVYYQILHFLSRKFLFFLWSSCQFVSSKVSIPKEWIDLAMATFFKCFLVLRDLFANLKCVFH